MDGFVDTSVLARIADTSHLLYGVATQAIIKLHRQGFTLRTAPQCLIEFRNVATRPAAVNGLGMSIPDTDALISSFEIAFPLLPETPDIYPAWKTLVNTLGVTGKQVHDARLAAICHVHGVGHLLTFNVSHFIRLGAANPGIVILDPHAI